MKNKSRFLRGQPIEPPAIDANMSIVDLIDKTFNAYNAARFREACQLFTERMLTDDVTVGMSLSGAMTPAEVSGGSCSAALPDARSFITGGAEPSGPLATAEYFETDASVTS